MAISMIPTPPCRVFLQLLGGLKGVIEKAEAHAKQARSGMRVRC